MKGAIIFQRTFGLLLIAICSLSCRSTTPADTAANSNAGQPQRVLWVRVDDVSTAKESFTPLRQLNSFETFRLEREAMQEELRSAPMEFSRQEKETVITLPMPDGTLARFRIEESPVISTALAEQFPNVKAYHAQGLDDPTAVARIEYTPDGLSAMVISAAGDFYVEPAGPDDSALHFSFFKRSLQEKQKGFECFVKRLDQGEGPELAKRSDREAAPDTVAALNNRVIDDDKIRKYRFAVATTGEYARAVHRPDNPQNPEADLLEDAFKAIHKTVNRLNLIFESEVGVRLELVDDEAKIIFTNPKTDPYVNNVKADSTTNQKVVNKYIHNEKYDIGHVFTTAQGGQAGQPSVCNPIAKADAATGRANPTGDPFDVDYLAHEIGHQFGASHSFNGTTGGCKGEFGRVPTAAYEPGSGSTIMGYSGTSITGGPICGSETVQSHSDAYFHANSLQEITRFITDTNPFGGATCAQIIPSSNKHRPVVNGGADFSIPKNTPFTLTATQGSDGDNDVLTYTWEQFDLGEPDPPNPADAMDFKKIRPIFRSRRGTPGPARTFPALSNLLASLPASVYTAESLPVIDRVMAFRVTVRDRRGRFGFDDVNVRVIGSAGPFRVTQPGAGAVWKRGSTQVVRWNVAQTAASPINCTRVRILLLVDGDETRPIVLNSQTDNDGEEAVTIPADVPLTSRARIKVEAIGNIFFNVSEGDIQISAG